MSKNVTIVGGGLVGSLWAVYMNKAGYNVKIYERRTDMRKNKMSAGKSINLAMSFRGWKALDDAGLGDEIRKIAIPMYGRELHLPDNTSNYQPYGINNQAIFSVPRGEINCMLLDQAEKNAQLHFNKTCIDADLDNGICYFRDNMSGEIEEVKSDLVFATDGAFSAVRYNAMQKLDRFDYMQDYIDDGYKEILLPANEDGSHKLSTNALHIWPRGRFMLIALPNFDGSYTCTLFMPFENHQYCFNNLTDKDKINDFFKEVFPDFYEMMPNVADTWNDFPLSSLAIVRCYPWIKGKFALMGDAAHATVPFFGQGMNCGFEDCSVMNQLMHEHNDWELIFKEYQRMRKPNGDAVQDLSLLNYIVMRDKVADPNFQLLQKLERRIQELYPNQYFSLYSMVSFTNIEYHIALSKGQEQEKMIQGIIEKNNITHQTSMETIDEIIHNHFSQILATN